MDPWTEYRGKVEVLAAQLCLTLCDLMDCSPPGSSVYGLLQTRILEWVAIPFSTENGDGQGSLACCCPWGCKELDTT